MDQAGCYGAVACDQSGGWVLWGGSGDFGEDQSECDGDSAAEYDFYECGFDGGWRASGGRG